jgi:hypothetical protein
VFLVTHDNATIVIVPNEEECTGRYKKLDLVLPPSLVGEGDKISILLPVPLELNP